MIEHGGPGTFRTLLPAGSDRPGPTSRWPDRFADGWAATTPTPTPTPAAPGPTARSVPAPTGLGPPLLGGPTVGVLHDAVRASLRLVAGLDPRWTWPGHPEREFLRAAHGHHVGGLLAPHAADLGLPEGLREGIARMADRITLKSLADAGLLHQVHGRLAAAGIPALFVKGLAVEAQTGRQVGDRGSGDIDVWVPPQQVESAIETLRPVWNLPDGYPRPGSSWAWRHWMRWGSEMPLLGPVTIDLHWQLHCVRDTLPDFAEAWAAREEVVVGGHTVPTLGRRHSLAHACRHAETDRWRILRSLVDIHLLLAGPNPAERDGPMGAPLRGRTFGTVDRSIGLPPGWTARAIGSRQWTAVLEEQRHLGTHTERVDRLTRPAYLRRVVGRLRPRGRQSVRDAVGVLSCLAVAPPYRAGSITTSSTLRGLRHGVEERVRYEVRRAGGSTDDSSR